MSAANIFKNPTRPKVLLAVKRWQIGSYVVLKSTRKSVYCEFVYENSGFRASRASFSAVFAIAVAVSSFLDAAYSNGCIYIDMCCFVCCFRYVGRVSTQHISPHCHYRGKLHNTDFQNSLVYIGIQFDTFYT